MSPLAWAGSSILRAAAAALGTGGARLASWWRRPVPRSLGARKRSCQSKHRGRSEWTNCNTLSRLSAGSRIPHQAAILPRLLCRASRGYRRLFRWIWELRRHNPEVGIMGEVPGGDTRAVMPSDLLGRNDSTLSEHRTPRLPALNASPRHFACPRSGAATAGAAGRAIRRAWGA
jgi:hypothetical protein